MKATLRKTVRKLADLPLIGRLVKIGVAVIRLPEFRASLESALYQQRPTSATAADGYSVFESQQLPTLLQAVSDVNHRQLVEANGHANLVRSVPVSLRKLTREIVQLREQNQRLESEIGARFAAIEQTSKDLGVQLAASDVNLASHADSLAIVRGEVTGAAERASAEIANVIERVTGEMAKVVERLSDNERKLSEMQSGRDSVAVEQEASQSRVAGLAESIQYLLGRVEFVRRELMFEMRYGAVSPGAEGEKLVVKGEILEVAKVEEARASEAGIRLNLGCGHVPLDGYLNVDRRALPRVDIVAEVDQLPFGPGEVAEICSAHLLEHFPQEQLRRELLPYWISLLRNDGVLRAIVPDGASMARAFTSQEYEFESLRQVTFGGQDYDGDFHYNMFSPDSLSEILREAGFTRITVVAENRENGGCKEFEIVAAR